MAHHERGTVLGMCVVAGVGLAWVLVVNTAIAEWRHARDATAAHSVPPSREPDWFDEDDAIAPTLFCHRHEALIAQATWHALSPQSQRHWMSSLSSRCAAATGDAMVSLYDAVSGQRLASFDGRTLRSR